MENVYGFAGHGHAEIQFERISADALDHVERTEARSVELGIASVLFERRALLFRSHARDTVYACSRI